MNARNTLILLTLAGLLLGGCAGSAATQSRPQLTVSGTGIVRLTPDLATINLGVTTQDNDVAQAVAANNLTAQAITDAVKGLGVAPEDVRTAYFNVSPQPQYDQTGMPTGQTIYWVNNTLLVTLRQVDQLGTLLQAAVEAGANNINGVSFDVADKSRAEEQARQAAMQDAAKRAARLATAAGAALGEVLSIYTGALTYGNVSYVEVANAGAGGTSAVPIAPGTFDVQVDVTVIYGLK
jgi:uncharacterized protein YggE